MEMKNKSSIFIFRSTLEVSKLKSNLNEHYSENVTPKKNNVLLIISPEKFHQVSYHST